MDYKKTIEYDYQRQSERMEFWGYYIRVEGDEDILVALIPKNIKS